MGDQTRRAADAIEDGLRLYSQGDLRAALGVWRGALEMDPDNKRARDYVRFVEENFEILDEKIRAGRARRASAERVATAMATGSAIEMEADDGEDADDDYDAFEVDDSGVSEAAADGDDAEVTVEKVPETKRTLQGWDSKVLHRDAAARVVESVDEGWDLDGLDEFLGTGTSGGTFAKPQLPDDATEPMADMAGSGEDSLMSDPEAGEVTLPAPRAMKISVPPPPALDPFDMSDFAPDAVATAEGVRGVGPGPQGPPAMPPEPEPREVRVSFRNSTAPPPARDPMPAVGPDEETMDRRGSWAIPATDGDVPPLERSRRPPTEDPSIGASSVEVDDQLLSFEDQTQEARRVPLSAMEDAIADLGPGVDPAVDPDGDRPTKLYSRPGASAGGRAPQTISLPLASTELAAELDDAVAGEEGTPENIAARVRWLFERAAREVKAGRAPLAAVAVDLALSEHPDSAVAQKIVHGNRDLVMEVYRSYLGDLGLVPALAQPIESIPVHELDHRAAFLLTRVDGVLTLEDILDVSGMARLEAYRHLCRLLMRGFLAVR